MDQLDMLGLILQNQGRAPAGEEQPAAAVDPVTMMMFGQPAASPLSLTGISQAFKQGTHSQPMTQADFLQKQLTAMQAQGLAQQQKGVEDYQKQLGELTNQQTNPWQAVAAGVSDFLNGTKNLDKIQQKQLANKQMALMGTEKIQKAKNDISENQNALIKTQLDYEKAREKNAADELRTRMMFGLAKDKLANKLSPGQEAADKKFGDAYQEWTQQGGSATVQGNLDSLKEAMAALQADSTLTGGTLEKSPFGATDAVQARVKPNAFAVKQKIYEAIQATLKSTLGAQFTAKEGEDLLNRSYDPRLSTEQNVEKLQHTIKKIQDKVDAFNASAKYFEEHGGSLAGQGLAAQQAAKKSGVGGLTPEQEARRQALLKKKAGG